VLLHRNIAEVQCCEVSGLCSLLSFVIWSLEKQPCTLDSKVKNRALKCRFSFSWWEHVGFSCHRIKEIRVCFENELFEMRLFAIYSWTLTMLLLFASLPFHSGVLSLTLQRLGLLKGKLKNLERN